MRRHLAALCFLTKTFKDEDVQRFIAITSDVNPLHVDDMFAAKARFGRRVLHGMLTASLFSAMVGMLLPGTGAIYRVPDLNFLRPVHVGETLVISSPMQRAGFLAGVTFVLGAIIGTFVIAPLLHRDAPVSPTSPTTAAKPVVKAADPFESAVAKGNEAMDAGRCADAIAAYDQALAVRFDADVATDRGVCLRQLGDRERALSAFEFVILKAPSHWKARYNLTAILLELGRVEEARASFAILERQRPNDETLRPLERALAMP